MTRQAPSLARAAIVFAAPHSGACARCEVRHEGVCAVLDDAELHRLGEIATQMTVARSACFIAQGEPARHFFNVTRGTAKLYKSLEDGRRQITGFLREGDFVGLAAEGEYGFSAEALEDLGLCRFDRARFASTLPDLPALERRLLDIACHELILAQDQMLVLGRKSATERLASFLLAWAARGQRACHGHVDAAAPARVALPMTRTDIADYLGLTTETVSRALSALRRDGLIEAAAGGHEVTLLDRRRLARLAAP